MGEFKKVSPNIFRNKYTLHNVFTDILEGYYILPVSEIAN